MLERLIRNFIWNDKTGGRVRQDVLQLEYSKGGLQLVDIDCKIQSQHVRRVMYLFSITDDKIERFLADRLIGSSTKYGQNGLSYGVISNLDRIKIIKSTFYKKALTIINNLDLKVKPGSIRTIQSEPLFYNKLFLDEGNLVFNMAQLKNKLPKTVREIQSHSQAREPEIRSKILAIKSSINKIDFTNKIKNEYLLDVANVATNIDDLNFKDIYKIFINKKHQIYEWEYKWEVTFSMGDLVWEDIWANVHTQLHNRHVQSSIWEMTHLNYWSGYKANEACKLCGEREHDTSHIINSCPVLLGILNRFNLQAQFNSKKKISFGTNDSPWDNFLLFHIKSIVFRARFQTNLSYELAMHRLSQNCKGAIKKDLQNRFFFAKSMGKIGEFLNIFFPDNINDNDRLKLIFEDIRLN